VEQIPDSTWAKSLPVENILAALSQLAALQSALAARLIGDICDLNGGNAGRANPVAASWTLEQGRSARRGLNVQPAQARELIDLITVAEVARRLGLAIGTVYNRIGRLDEQDGVVRWGSKCTRINWTVFYGRLSSGQISMRPKR
jgi:hypothetical protein